MQMSYWGATVITNLFSAIPWIGQDLVYFIWGGYSVDNATLNRFFSLHFLLPFILAALAAVHLMALHQYGSTNPLAVKGDNLRFHPYFTSKDFVGFLWLFLFLGMFVFFMPNSMGHPDNYIPANPLVTPHHIVPEWYFLPFYAILRSIPNKALGVIAMFSSLLILLALPWFTRLRPTLNTPFMKFAFWLFVVNFFLLMWLGGQPIHSPYVQISQVATVLYFGYFVLLCVVG